MSFILKTGENELLCDQKFPQSLLKICLSNIFNCDGNPNRLIQIKVCKNKNQQQKQIVISDASVGLVEN